MDARKKVGSPTRKARKALSKSPGRYGNGAAVTNPIQGNDEVSGTALERSPTARDDEMRATQTALRAAEAALAAATTEAADDAAPCRGVVQLDVGGTLFKTTVSTLTKNGDTFFAALFSGNFAVPRQADGSIFIDRDGRHFGRLLNFLRSGEMAWPDDEAERREVWTEAAYYGLDQMLAAEQADLAAAARQNSDPDHSATPWRSNVIVVGASNITNHAVASELTRAQVQCPETSELAWRSIHLDGLTVIFQIINSDQGDFSLKNIPALLRAVSRWNRPNLRFVLVYDAELIRELLKLSGEPFSDSSFVWYFSNGKLIDCSVEWRLRYVGESVWKFYAGTISTPDRPRI